MRSLRSICAAAMCLSASFVLAGCDGDPGPGTADAGADAPTGTVVYVDAAAAPGGDGSAARPYADLPEAIDDLAGRTEVSVAAGEYTLPSGVELDHALTVRGAGIDQSWLEASTGAASSWTTTTAQLTSLSVRSPLAVAAETVSLTSSAFEAQFEANAADLVVLDGVAFRNAGASVSAATVDANGVDVRGGPGLVFDAATATLRDIEVRELVGPAVVVRGGEYDLREIEVTDVEGADADTPDAGVGVLVDDARVDVEGLRIYRTSARGLAFRAGEGDLRDVRIAGAGITGLSIQGGATVVAEDVEVSEAGSAIFVSDGGLVLSDSRLERAREVGLLASAGSDVVLLDSTLFDCDNGLVSILGEGATARLAGNVIRGSEAGSCVAVASAGGRVEVETNTISDCGGAGISVLDSHDVQVADNEVFDVYGVEPFADLAEGISAVRSTLQVTRNEVHDVDGAGVAFLNSGGTVADNIVRGAGDAGVRVVERGRERVDIDGNEVTTARIAGIVVLTADVSVVDNTVTAVALDPAEGLGEGVFFGAGADVAVRGNVIRGAEGNGILFLDGARGTIDGNDIAGSTGYGILELCPDSLAANDVEVGENALRDNAAGPGSFCD